MKLNKIINILKKVNFIKNLSLKKRIIFFSCSGILIISLLLFIFCLPNPLFDEPYSIVLLDKEGEFLGAKISTDQQWRFPETDKLSDKFKICIINFEDKNFKYHFGIDPFAMARAVKQNIQRSKIVSGGSTITMQTIRLMRHRKERSFKEKIIEAILALRLECSYSKNKILCLYASHAPFGGNVVGLEAASWRYFGRDAQNLSWAENAMLAVMPNSPAMINTQKNRIKLKGKRDKLLKKLYDKNIISETELELAIEEKIPEHPQPYPMYAYHLLSHAAKKKHKNKIATTLNINYQKRANTIIEKYNNIYKRNNINNLAALVLEVRTGNVTIYVGNADFSSDTREKAVDMIRANRSTGSVLKPFLYAATLTEGEILPKTILRDVPTRMGGFSPENFDKKYDGAVHADAALSKSLNVPFVHLLKQYDTYKFLKLLQLLGLKSINKTSEHYGLSLILGGAESNLWELCAAYASMARNLHYYTENQSKYPKNGYFPANYLKNKNNNPKSKNAEEKETSILSAASIWFTFEAMLSVNRPGEEKYWQNFSSKQKVAWKTGTSFGFKDAWAIAVTPDYVVGIWVGNATGEPKSGIIGQKVAAPVLFEILNILPSYKKWFNKPLDDMVLAAICRKSGQLASENCEIIDTLFIPEMGINSENCRYCKTINIDATKSFLVNSNCYPLDKIVRKKYFILSPAMELYYKRYHPEYEQLPPIMQGCEGDMSVYNSKVMEIIYPNLLSKVYIPVNLQNDTLAAVFQVAHIDENALIYWFLNEKSVAVTKNIHEKEFKLKSGNYVLTLVDNKGNRISRKFSVVDRLEE